MFRLDPGEYDEEFHELNDMIQATAEDIDGISVNALERPGARRNSGRLLLGVTEHARFVWSGRRPQASKVTVD